MTFLNVNSPYPLKLELKLYFKCLFNFNSYFMFL